MEKKSSVEREKARERVFFWDEKDEYMYMDTQYTSIMNAFAKSLNKQLCPPD